MWTCPYCGGTLGQRFDDDQLHGVLCLQPDCGRFAVQDPSHEDGNLWDDSDF
jgi:hypothetical protein